MYWKVMRLKEGTFILIADHIPVKNQFFNSCAEASISEGFISIINIYNE